MLIFVSVFFCWLFCNACARAAGWIVKRSRSRFKHTRGLIYKWQWFKPLTKSYQNIQICVCAAAYTWEQLPCLGLKRLHKLFFQPHSIISVLLSYCHKSTGIKVYSLDINTDVYGGDQNIANHLKVIFTSNLCFKMFVGYIVYIYIYIYICQTCGCHCMSSSKLVFLTNNCFFFFYFLSLSVSLSFSHDRGYSYQTTWGGQQVSFVLPNSKYGVPGGGLQSTVPRPDYSPGPTDP